MSQKHITSKINSLESQRDEGRQQIDNLERENNA